MLKGQSLKVAVLCLFMGLSGMAQEEGSVKPMLELAPAESNGGAKVTAVYGVTADDYLPTLEEARRHLRPNVRRGGSHPSFDLPDVFYFVGGPIFLLLFLRVLVIFLNGFEEKRKEELQKAASESIHPQKS